MSHDLRTPLSVILGFSELLQLESLPAIAGEYLQEVDKAGRHLLAIIDDVLDVSRIEAGNLRMSLESVDLADVVREVVSMMQPAAFQQEILLEAGPDPVPRIHINADRHRLVQVLLNLVSNGIKYNRPGGRVKLACENMSPNRIRLLVEDTGIGIAIEQQPRLYSPFERLLARKSSAILLPAIQGRMGLDLVRQHHPDLVLLDMHLPDMSGEEVLTALRADPTTAAIPVVVLSADATPRNVQQIEAMGVRAYLTKPIDVRQFLAIVDEVRASKPVSA